MGLRGYKKRVDSNEKGLEAEKKKESLWRRVFDLKREDLKVKTVIKMLENYDVNVAKVDLV